MILPKRSVSTWRLAGFIDGMGVEDFGFIGINLYSSQGVTGSLVPRPGTCWLTCLVLLEAFAELKQLLQTPQPPALPLSRPVIGPGDLVPLTSVDLSGSTEWTLGGSIALTIFGTSGCPFVSS